MQTRTFQAGNMAEALQMVKTELGPDAMIISSRREKRKGILGLFRKPVFRVTATAGSPPQTRRYPAVQEETSQGDTTLDEFRKSMLEPLVRELRELRERVEAIAGQDEPRRMELSERPVQAVMEKGNPDAVCDFTVPELSQDTRRDLKKMLVDSVMTAEVGTVSPLPFPIVSPVKETLPGEGDRRREVDAGSLGRISTALHDAGVGEAAIVALVQKVKTMESQGDVAEDLGKKLKDAVENTVKCSGPIKLKKGGPRIVALVGPTGVGKTTTIAKLAAHYTVVRKVKTALVTIDTFRVGAVEQLKTYSRIMGVPLEVASTPKELEKAIALHQDKDLILIDTVGRSPKDRETIDNLRDMLRSASTIETHLCVAATTRERELRSIVESFSALPIKRLLFTKLDESSSFGSIINLHLEKKLPLSYFTKGQRVPEDIEPATGKKVADLVLGED
jgi:flagellar biosynthesis protein FlhF